MNDKEKELFKKMQELIDLQDERATFLESVIDGLEEAIQEQEEMVVQLKSVIASYEGEDHAPEL